MPTEGALVNTVEDIQQRFTAGNAATSEVEQHAPLIHEKVQIARMFLISVSWFMRPRTVIAPTGLVATYKAWLVSLGWTLTKTCATTAGIFEVADTIIFVQIHRFARLPADAALRKQTATYCLSCRAATSAQTVVAPP